MIQATQLGLSHAAKERPILFSGSMIQAILEGRKTQTRRIVKRQPEFDGKDWWWVHKNGAKSKVTFENLLAAQPIECPYGQVGDHLWVRETWRHALSESHECYAYRANMQYSCGAFMPQPDGNTGGWKPSIHMPRKASRISLEVTDIRVERLQDISEKDAISEGIIKHPATVIGWGSEKGHWWGDDRSATWQGAWINLWNSINSDRGFGWDLNPWVWIVEFRREIS